MSDRGVELVWDVEKCPFKTKVELDLRDLVFLRLEVLDYSENAWNPYHRENSIATITAPIYVEGSAP